MKPKHTYFVEMTDTFGGEANYCWANRFKVHATTMSGAMRKVAKETGHSGRIRKYSDYGDMRRYNVNGACICYFVQWFDESDELYLNLIEL